jgi:hypothetical protein
MLASEEQYDESRYLKALNQRNAPLKIYISDLTVGLRA